MDFYFPDQNTVLEVYGPTHFINEYSEDFTKLTRQLNGRSYAKDSILTKAGYKVRGLDYEVFDLSDEELLSRVKHALEV